MTEDDGPTDPRAGGPQTAAVPRRPAPAIPVLSPSMGFDAACDAVLEYLQQQVPMGMWAVTRVDDGEQVILDVANDAGPDGYDAEAGMAVPWDDSFCRRMVDGAGQVVPDVDADESYRDTPNRSLMPVDAYVGVPLEHPDGGLFGSICGISPHAVADAETLRSQEPLLNLLGALLSTVLAADLERSRAERIAQWQGLQAETDSLTGLLNRRGWDRSLETEEQRYRRFGDPGAVVILDLDRLKIINDTLGHAAGDAHLRVAAAALRSTVRESDVLARLGGDEFGVLATRATRAETTTLVHRLREALDAVGVQASLGSAPLSLVTGFSGAWRIADEQMYADKAQRRLSTVG